MRIVDVALVGGGIIGFAIATALALRDAGLRIVILEAEPRVGLGATAKATGGIRHQFSSATNVRLTQLSYQTFEHFEERFRRDIGFRTHGYLFVTTSRETLVTMAKGVKLQRALGVPSEMVSASDCQRLYPSVNADDLVGGSYCGIDGSANPSDVLLGYRDEASARGIVIATEEPVIEIAQDGGRIASVGTPRERYSTQVVIDAAGPRVAEVAALVGITLPARPFKRQVFVTAQQPEMPRGLPLLVDLDTGWYAHQERSGRLLLGGTDKDSRPGLSTDVDWDGFDLVADAALRRIPNVAPSLKVETAYAGLRTLTPDYHGIVGRTSLDGFFVATNCNGHGFMHAPAIGQLVAEEVLDQRATTLDLTPLRLERFSSRETSIESVMF